MNAFSLPGAVLTLGLLLLYFASCVSAKELEALCMLFQYLFAQKSLPYRKKQTCLKKREG